MALSDEEKQLLAQLEASLAAEDPKLASALRGTGTRKVHRRRAALAGLLFVLGLTALVSGMQINPLVSVGGFAIMLVAAVIGINSWQHVNDIDPAEQSTPKSAAPSASIGKDTKPFMDKMEERWRKRQEEGR